MRPAAAGTGGMANELVGGNWLHRHEYRTVAQDLAAIDAVTRDDVIAVLAKYPLAEGTTVAIGPLEQISMAR